MVITARQLRHMTGTAVLNAGMSEMQIAVTLGHEGIETVKTYTHGDENTRGVAIQAGVDFLYIANGQKTDIGGIRQAWAVTNACGEMKITCPCCGEKCVVSTQNIPQNTKVTAC